MSAFTSDASRTSCQHLGQLRRAGVATRSVEHVDVTFVRLRTHSRLQRPRQITGCASDRLKWPVVDWAVNASH